MGHEGGFISVPFVTLHLPAAPTRVHRGEDFCLSQGVNGFSEPWEIEAVSDGHRVDLKVVNAKPWRPFHLCSENDRCCPFTGHWFRNALLPHIVQVCFFCFVTKDKTCCKNVAFLAAVLLAIEETLGKFALQNRNTCLIFPEKQFKNKSYL